MELLVKLGLCTNKHAPEKLKTAKAGRAPEDKTKVTAEEVTPEPKPRGRPKKKPEFAGLRKKPGRPKLKKADNIKRPVGRSGMSI